MTARHRRVLDDSKNGMNSMLKWTTGQQIRSARCEQYDYKRNIKKCARSAENFGNIVVL